MRIIECFHLIITFFIFGWSARWTTNDRERESERGNEIQNEIRLPTITTTGRNIRLIRRNIANFDLKWSKREDEGMKLQITEKFTVNFCLMQL